jgi:hypothetical protein
VVNGNLRGAKEQRPFKPQVEGSIPSRRTSSTVISAHGYAGNAGFAALRAR